MIVMIKLGAILLIIIGKWIIYRNKRNQIIIDDTEIKKMSIVTRDIMKIMELILSNCEIYV